VSTPRDGLPRHAEALAEVALGLIQLTTKCHQIGRSEARAVAQVLESELGETLRMPPLGLFRSSLPPGDGGLGDSEQCTELGLGITEPFADSSDVLWLHDRFVGHRPTSRTSAIL
jgi:hypothetical protein